MFFTPQVLPPSVLSNKIGALAPLSTPTATNIGVTETVAELLVREESEAAIVVDPTPTPERTPVADTVAIAVSAEIQETDEVILAVERSR